MRVNVGTSSGGPLPPDLRMCLHEEMPPRDSAPGRKCMLAVARLEEMLPFDLRMRLQQKPVSFDFALGEKRAFAVTRLEETLPFGKM